MELLAENVLKSIRYVDMAPFSTTSPTVNNLTSIPHSPSILSLSCDTEQRSDNTPHISISSSFVSFLCDNEFLRHFDSEFFRELFFKEVIRKHVRQSLWTLLSLIHVPLDWADLLLSLTSHTLQNENSHEWFLSTPQHRTPTQPLFTHTGPQHIPNSRRIIFRSLPGGSNARLDSFVFNGVVIDANPITREKTRLGGRKARVALFDCRLDGLKSHKDRKPDNVEKTIDEKGNIVRTDEQTPEATESKIFFFDEQMKMTLESKWELIHRYITAFGINLIFTTHIVTQEVQSLLDRSNIAIFVISPEKMALLSFSLNLPLVTDSLQLNPRQIAVCDWWKCVWVEDETIRTDSIDTSSPEELSISSPRSPVWADELDDEDYFPPEKPPELQWDLEDEMVQIGHKKAGLQRDHLIPGEVSPSLLALSPDAAVSEKGKWVLFMNTESQPHTQTICLRGAPMTILSRVTNVGRICLQLLRAGQADCSLWMALHMHPSTFTQDRTVSSPFPFDTFGSIFPRKKLISPLPPPIRSEDGGAYSPNTDDAQSTERVFPENEEKRILFSSAFHFLPITLESQATQEMKWLEEMFQLSSLIRTLKQIIQNTTSSPGADLQMKTSPGVDSKLQIAGYHITDASLHEQVSTILHEILALVSHKSHNFLSSEEITTNLLDLIFMPSSTVQNQPRSSQAILKERHFRKRQINSKFPYLSKIPHNILWMYDCHYVPRTLLMNEIDRCLPSPISETRIISIQKTLGNELNIDITKHILEYLLLIVDKTTKDAIQQEIVKPSLSEVLTQTTFFNRLEQFLSSGTPLETAELRQILSSQIPLFISSFPRMSFVLRDADNTQQRVMYNSSVCVVVVNSSEGSRTAEATERDEALNQTLPQQSPQARSESPKLTQKFEDDDDEADGRIISVTQKPPTSRMFPLKTRSAKLISARPEFPSQSLSLSPSEANLKSRSSRAELEENEGLGLSGQGLDRRESLSHLISTASHTLISSSKGQTVSRLRTFSDNLDEEPASSLTTLSFGQSNGTSFRTLFTSRVMTTKQFCVQGETIVLNTLHATPMNTLGHFVLTRLHPISRCIRCGQNKSNHCDTFEILGHRVDATVETNDQSAMQDEQEQVYMWIQCRKCRAQLTPPVVASSSILNMPLARFLDLLYSCECDRLIPYQFTNSQLDTKPEYPRKSRPTLQSMKDLVAQKTNLPASQLPVSIPNPQFTEPTTEAGSLTFNHISPSLMGSPPMLSPRMSLNAVVPIALSSPVNVTRSVLLATSDSYPSPIQPQIPVPLQPQIQSDVNGWYPLPFIPRYNHPLSQRSDRESPGPSPGPSPRLPTVQCQHSTLSGSTVCFSSGSTTVKFEHWTTTPLSVSLPHPVLEWNVSTEQTRFEEEWGSLKLALNRLVQTLKGKLESVTSLLDILPNSATIASAFLVAVADQSKWMEKKIDQIVFEPSIFLKTDVKSTPVVVNGFALSQLKCQILLMSLHWNGRLSQLQIAFVTELHSAVIAEYQRNNILSSDPSKHNETEEINAFFTNQMMNETVRPDDPLMSEQTEDFMRNTLIGTKTIKPKRSGLRRALKDTEITIQHVLGHYAPFAEELLKEPVSSLDDHKAFQLITKLQKARLSKDVKKEVQRILTTEMEEEPHAADMIRKEFERKMEETLRRQEDENAKRVEDGSEQCESVNFSPQTTITPSFPSHSPKARSLALRHRRNPSDQPPRIEPPQFVDETLNIGERLDGDGQDRRAALQINFNALDNILFGHQKVNSMESIESQVTTHTKYSSTSDQQTIVETMATQSPEIKITSFQSNTETPDDLETIQAQIDKRIGDMLRKRKARHQNLNGIVEKSTSIDRAITSLSSFLDETSAPFTAFESEIRGKRIPLPAKNQELLNDTSIDLDVSPFLPFVITHAAPRETPRLDPEDSPVNEKFDNEAGLPTVQEHHEIGEEAESGLEVGVEPDGNEEEQEIEEEEEYESEDDETGIELPPGTDPIWATLPPLSSSLRSYISSLHPCLPSGLFGEKVLVDENEVTSLIASVLLSRGYLDCVLKSAAMCVGVPTLMDEGLWTEQMENSEDAVPKMITGDLSSNQSMQTPASITLSSTPPSAPFHIDPILKSDSTIQACLECSSRDDYCCRYSDGKMHLSITLHYSLQFHALRAKTIGNWRFIHSLLRCSFLDAKGGKSNASFFRTGDKRFVVKQISGVEMRQLLESAFDYFYHYSDTVFGGSGSLLLPIVAIATVQQAQSSDANSSVPIATKRHARHYVIMENQSYDQTYIISFDLKGSIRNRLVKDTGLFGGVLQDSNYLEMMFNWRMKLETHDWQKLIECADRDSKFLCDLNVIDYSLLVGVREDSPVIHVGIIDYIRQYTWDKQLESIVKKTGILGQGSLTPTIIRPSEYRQRFMDSVKVYFTQIPARFELCLGIELSSENSCEEDSDNG